AGLLMMGFGWFIADPIISFVIAALILHTTWDLAKRSWNVLIDAIPPGVTLDEVAATLLTLPGAMSVKDLHVWSLNSSQTALTARLLVQPGTDTNQTLLSARTLMLDKHKIQHATLQIEIGPN